jgi:hypothetical protein
MDTLKKLNRKRDKIRLELKKHFETPVIERNYAHFETVVENLDKIRTQIKEIKAERGI